MQPFYRQTCMYIIEFPLTHFVCRQRNFRQPKLEKKMEPQIFALINEVSYLGVIYPNGWQSKSSKGQQAMSENFSWAKISSAKREMPEWKFSFKTKFPLRHFACHGQSVCQRESRKQIKPKMTTRYDHFIGEVRVVQGSISFSNFLCREFRQRQVKCVSRNPALDWWGPATLGSKRRPKNLSESVKIRPKISAHIANVNPKFLMSLKGTSGRKTS